MGTKIYKIIYVYSPKEQIVVWRTSYKTSVYKFSFHRQRRLSRLTPDWLLTSRLPYYTEVYLPAPRKDS